jgi:bifunctional ADP-heptose synthase (sugar kinase/adenylyltransferase)
MTIKLEAPTHLEAIKFIITLMEQAETHILIDPQGDSINRFSQLSMMTLVHFTLRKLLDQELSQILLWRLSLYIMHLMELEEIDMLSKLIICFNFTLF